MAENISRRPYAELGADAQTRLTERAKQLTVEDLNSIGAALGYTQEHPVKAAAACCCSSIICCASVVVEPVQTV